LHVAQQSEEGVRTLQNLRRILDDSDKAPIDLAVQCYRVMQSPMNDPARGEFADDDMPRGEN